LLHTAARHSRPDCMPLLVSKGVDVTALDSEGRSALQLACLYSGSDTVQLLFDSNGWLDSLATACMLNTVIAGNTDTLALLIERGISCSDVIDDGSTGYTLLHAAAVYSRLECAGMLIRNGYTAVALAKNGESAVDSAFEAEIPAVFKRNDIDIKPWELCKPTALLLLQYGCEYNASKVSNNKFHAAVVAQYLNKLREASLKQQQLLQLHAAGTYSVNDDRSHTVSANATAVQVQLVNADTHVKSSTVYTVDTTLLAKLHALAVDSSTSILLNMLVPPESWGVSNTTTSDTIMRILSYDGKHHMKVTWCARAHIAAKNFYVHWRQCWY
jgi:Ankyrin repeats (many copies)